MPGWKTSPKYYCSSRIKVFNSYVKAISFAAKVIILEFWKERQSFRDHQKFVRLNLQSTYVHCMLVLSNGMDWCTCKCWEQYIVHDCLQGLDQNRIADRQLYIIASLPSVWVDISVHVIGFSVHVVDQHFFFTDQKEGQGWVKVQSTPIGISFEALFWKERKWFCPTLSLRICNDPSAQWFTEPRDTTITCVSFKKSYKSFEEINCYVLIVEVAPCKPIYRNEIQIKENSQRSSH